MLLNAIDEPLPQRLAHVQADDLRELAQIDVATKDTADYEVLLTAGWPDGHGHNGTGTKLARHLLLRGGRLAWLLSQDLADAVREGWIGGSGLPAVG